MTAPDYEGLVDWLREEFGELLRWTASFDAKRFDYDVRYVREDLKAELTSRDLDFVVHRSLAVFNRDHVEDVYAHLGPAEALVVQHERATAVHVYLTGAKGVVVKLEREASVTVPEFAGECLDHLGVER